MEHRERVIKLLFPTVSPKIIFDIVNAYRYIPDDKYNIYTTQIAGQKFDVDKLMKANKILEPVKVKQYIHQYLLDKKKTNIVFTYIDSNDMVTMRLTPQKPNSNDCLILSFEKFVESSTKYTIAHIQGISFIDGCVPGFDVSGSELLKLGLDVIDKLKSKYNVKGIQLIDNSIMRCPKNRESYSDNNINLAIMSTLLYGTTWYGKYGFAPYGKVNELKYIAFKRNKEIMATIKTKDVGLYDLIKHRCAKLVDKDGLKQLKAYFDKHKDDLLKDTLRALLKHYDDTCLIFQKIYIHVASKIGITDMNTYVFYKKL